MAQRDLRDAPGLFVETLRHFSALMQDEIQLAKSELRNNLTRAGSGVAFVAIAALIALVALNVLAGALVAWVAASGLSAGLAALIVGGALLAIATIFALVGRSRLSADTLAPDRTLENVQRDMNALREATHA